MATKMGALHHCSHQRRRVYPAVGFLELKAISKGEKGQLKMHCYGWSLNHNY
jgi:hypothetical protein